MDAVLGIDIAKAKFDVALLTPDGKRRRKSCPNTPRGFDELAQYLHDAGHVVSVVNPAIIHAFAASQWARAKTDRVDAELIARYTATQRPPVWTPAPREIRELQALVRRLDALQGMRTQEANRLAAGAGSPAVDTSIRTVLTTLEAEITAVQHRSAIISRTIPVFARNAICSRAFPASAIRRPPCYSPNSSINTTRARARPPRSPGWCPASANRARSARAADW